MNHDTNGYEQHLSPLKKRFIAAALLLLIVGTICVIQSRDRRVLEKSLAELTKAQIGLDKVKAATANRRQVMAEMQSKFSRDPRKISPEMVLYGKVDDLKSQFKPDDMTITTIEKKGGEASLPYTLKFNDPDFNTMLNNVSYLHSAIFPLTPVSSISIKQSGDGIVVTLVGKIITSETAKP